MMLVKIDNTMVVIVSLLVFYDSCKTNYLLLLYRNTQCPSDATMTMMKSNKILSDNEQSREVSTSPLSVVRCIAYIWQV